MFSSSTRLFRHSSPFASFSDVRHFALSLLLVINCLGERNISLFFPIFVIQIYDDDDDDVAAAAAACRERERKTETSVRQASNIVSD